MVKKKKKKMGKKVSRKEIIAKTDTGLERAMQKAFRSRRPVSESSQVIKDLVDRVQRNTLAQYYHDHLEILLDGQYEGDAVGYVESLSSMEVEAKLEEINTPL